jgi:hypothetical protein
MIGVTVSSNCAAADVNLLDHFWRASEIVGDSPSRVLRMDVDLTGDGVPEVLLANSQKSGTSGVQEWFVYTRVQGRQYRLLGIIAFSHQLFLVTKQDPPRIVTYYKDEGSIVTLTVTINGFVQESTRGDVDFDARAGDFASWRSQVRLKPVGASFADFEGTAPPTWKHLITDETVTELPSLEDLVVAQ